MKYPLSFSWFIRVSSPITFSQLKKTISLLFNEFPWEISFRVLVELIESKIPSILFLLWETNFGPGEAHTKHKLFIASEEITFLIVCQCLRYFLSTTG